MSRTPRVVFLNAPHVLTHTTSPARARANLRVRSAFREGVKRYLVSQDDALTFVPWREVAARLRREREHVRQLDLARSELRQGIWDYKALRIPAAIRHLTRARALFRDNQLGLLYPDEEADILLYLSLGYLERKDEIFAVGRHLQELILVAPDRALRAGLYPDPAVKTYQHTRAALIETLREKGADVASLNQARHVARATGADYVMLGRVVPTSGEGAKRPETAPHEVALFLYSRKRDELLRAEQLTVSRLTPSLVREAAGRLASRYTTCIRTPDQSNTGRPVPSSRGTSPVRLSVHASYASFMKYPERFGRPYGNLGMGVGVRWALTDEFDLVSELQVLIAQSDYDMARITEDVSTIRGFLGAELSLAYRRARFGLQIAGDVTRVSDFEVWGNAACIPKPLGTPGCGTEARQAYQLGWMWGVNVRPSLSIRVLPFLEGVAKGGFSYFLIQPNSTELNFPISGELGLRYRF